MILGSRPQLILQISCNRRRPPYCMHLSNKGFLGTDFIFQIYISQLKVMSINSKSVFMEQLPFHLQDIELNRLGNKTFE